MLENQSSNPCEVAVRSFEKMGKAEVINAQRAWAKAVIDQDVETLLGLYDFGSPDEPLTRAQIEGLYTKFSKRTLTDRAIDSTSRAILDLENLRNLNALMHSLSCDVKN